MLHKSPRHISRSAFPAHSKTASLDNLIGETRRPQGILALRLLRCMLTAVEFDIQRT